MQKKEMMRLTKGNFTPLTNLGCESEFGMVGNNFKHPGGGTNLKTVSDKLVVSRNAKWKWASNSAEAKNGWRDGKRFCRASRCCRENLPCQVKENRRRKFTKN